jgi:6-phosphofructokinase 1
VIGIPKTIDNDISYIHTSFGFNTASSEAREVILAAHNEAKGARNGVGLVKLMGRESGFIAAYAALASTEVNFCLVPESRFTLQAFLKALHQRLERKQHAVIAVAEGAGQDLLQASLGHDSSGNVRLGDIGLFLRDQIKAYFNGVGMKVNLKYIDPSYIIRGIPANAFDSAFCLELGFNAVHAGMAGRTNMVVGNWRNELTHVPIPLAASKRKKINPSGHLWSSVLACTGQPREMF